MLSIVGHSGELSGGDPTLLEDGTKLIVCGDLSAYEANVSQQALGVPSGLSQIYTRDPIATHNLLRLIVLLRYTAAIRLSRAEAERVSVLGQCRGSATMDRCPLTLNSSATS